jgi:hypothetical protein
MIGFDEAAVTRVLREMRMAQSRANMAPLLGQTRGEPEPQVEPEPSVGQLAQESPLASDVAE